MAIEKRTPRRELEKRAYRYGLATAGFGVATVVWLVLAVAGVTSLGVTFLLALLTAGAGFLFKRTVSSR
jgi:fatty acid desaturase